MAELLLREAGDIIVMLLWVALFFTPAATMLWLLAREKRKYDEEAKIPFTEFPQRPPGESSRTAADQRFEYAFENLLLLILACGVFGMAVAGAKSGHRGVVATGCGILVIGITAFVIPRILRSFREYRRYRLGYTGERLVGEELNQLLAKGYRVFHDVPFDTFNVDHVAVGPAGIFIVETKTRRKWKVKVLKHPAHMVYYDGSELTWPSGKSDRFGLDQTERNARTVSEWLTNATGHPVSCRGILTLPGWWVERRIVHPARVTVLSAKKLHRYFPTTARQPIAPDQLRRICYHLGERCRTAVSEYAAATSPSLKTA